ncbi:MAG: acyl-CoA thioesterase [Desulfosarcina sp.]|nr:acyl-CoA thioesterase [Desulfobacterales bacterium]
MQALSRHQMLEDYPVVIEIPVAWGEMDAFGHVNNIVYLRYFESARIAYFEKLKVMQAMAATGIGPILAETRCRYKLPLTYPDTVSVGAKIVELMADRFLMHYRVVSHRHGKVAAEGDGRVVPYDFGAQTKTPLPEVISDRIRALEGLVVSNSQ